MKRLLILVFLFMFFQGTYAQEAKGAKPDCTPEQKKSCRPAQTKLGEAKVIINLREDIQQLKNEVGLLGAIEAGISDDESLDILVEEMQQITQVKGLEFPTLRESKAGKVSDLKKLVEKASDK